MNASAYIGLKAPPKAAMFERILICKDVEEYARELFNFFRECDEGAPSRPFSVKRSMKRDWVWP